ncbi:hypothetical protein BXY58_1887 [Epilithonimonas arachidiradicis]|uniref:Uncharacterized protein n=1 Tax=Epilithonimonas arachidiradicis TaxID=1617282 RepID=A0A420DA33_9FLAO|nr:hypothetical protein BXY58_1887 [Epilithonimonas arachidiradicis]
MLNIAKLQPDLSGALFLFFAKKEKSGSGRRIKLPKYFETLIVLK